MYKKGQIELPSFFVCASNLLLIGCSSAEPISSSI
jgi:hypothetical protein